MSGGGEVCESFWTTDAGVDAVEVSLPEQLDGGEPPALRTLSRPPSWNAPSVPASALASLYTSAQRRATEVLRAALEDCDAEFESGEGDDETGARP